MSAYADITINHKKHALRVSYDYRGSRQGFVQARTLARCLRKKRAHIFVFDMCSLFSLSMLYSIFNFLNASLFATVYLLHGY